MLYYKVFRDRDFINYVSIDETELEKALAAFRFGTSVIFNNGALEKVGDILPDYNRSMGWNESYKLGDDDWSDIHSKGVDKKLKELSQHVKEKIDYLIETNQKNLIGKNITVEIPKNKALGNQTKSLIEKMTI